MGVANFKLKDKKGGKDSEKVISNFINDCVGSWLGFGWLC